MCFPSSKPELSGMGQANATCVKDKGEVKPFPNAANSRTSEGQRGSQSHKRVHLQLTLTSDLFGKRG